MKTVISALIVLALIVLFAQMVLPLGSYTATKAANKPGRSFIEAVSSQASEQGTEAAWTKDGRRRH